MILVTGGNGFVGRRLLRRLAASGREAFALVRTGSGGDDPWESIACDLADGAALKAVIGSRRWTAIVHLASMLGTASTRDPAAALAVNTLASARLFAAAAAAGVPRVVFASSISVYGTAAWLGDRAAHEADPAGPDDVYGASKLAAERAAAALAGPGTAIACLRLPAVLGAGATASSPGSRWRNELFETIERGGQGTVPIPLAAAERLPLVHVADVATHLMAVLERMPPGFSCFDTPCETWLLGALADAVRRRCPGIEVTFGDGARRGFPGAVDWSRWRTTLGEAPHDLAARLVPGA